MAFEHWVEDTKRRYRDEDTLTATTASLQEFWVGLLRRFGENVYNYGTPVWEKDWDILLVMDTCRPDALAEVADEYDFLSEYDPETDMIHSVASRSPEWIEKTFHNEYASDLQETSYVSANVHSEDVPNPELNPVFDEVWKYGWEDELGNVPPEVMVDRAIDVWRTSRANRMIVHFMQPHQPYLPLVKEHPEWFHIVYDRLDESQTPASEHEDKMIWERLRDGEISHDEMWDAYIETLRWGLDEVEDLLKNVDADSVVITSDHGEAFGEWGCYGHNSYVPIPELKNVPWVEVEGNDTHSRISQTDADTDVELSDDEVNERLRNLGYNE